MIWSKKKSPKPTVFLHIGTNKTGTTALQSVFNRQRQLLLSQGVLYPVNGCSGQAHYRLSDCLGFKMGVSASAESSKREISKLQKSFLKEIENNRCDQVIFSSENFVIPKAIEPVTEFFTGFDVKIVIYLRRHDSWWESAYNQAVKMVPNPPWQPGFQHYLRFQKRNKHYGDYRILVDRWAMAFGKDNIIIRPFETAQNQPNIVVDFFNAIGLAHVVEKIDLTPVQANKSLPAYNLALIDAFQRAKIDPGTRIRLLKYAQSCISEQDKFSIITPVLRRKLVDDNSDDYTYIAKEYLGRDDGRLFFEPLPEPNENWHAPHVPSKAEIVEKTIAALAAIDTA